MLIVAKRAFRFVDWEIYQPDRTVVMPDGTERVVKGEKTAKELNSFIVRPSTRPQLVPDWVQNDGLFQLAIADGNLKVLP